MDTNEFIQYILVALLLIAVCVWTYRRSVKRKNGKGGCCGCSMSRICINKPRQTTAPETALTQNGKRKPRRKLDHLPYSIGFAIQVIRPVAMTRAHGKCFAERVSRSPHTARCSLLNRECR